MAAVLWEVDENGQDTGRIAGVEIFGFLEIEHWDAFVDVPGLWRFPGQEPLRLDVLLKREQQRQRRQASVATHRHS